MVTHADLTGLAPICNEIVVDGRGNAYVNGGDFGEPGMVALVRPDGSVRQVADGIEFGNGMAVTPDNSTLIVAESYGHRLTAFDIGSGRRALEPPGVGRPRRGLPGRHLSRRRRCGLVRQRARSTMRAGA